MLSNLAATKLLIIYEVTKHEDMQFESFEAMARLLKTASALYEKNLHEMDQEVLLRLRVSMETLNA